MGVVQLVWKLVSEQVPATDRSLEGRHAGQLTTLSARMGVEHANPAIQIEPRHFECATQVAVVADDQCRLERSAMGEIDEVDREIDIGTLLGRQLDLDRATGEFRRPYRGRATARLDECPERDAASTARQQRAKVRALRLGQPGIPPSIEERGVEVDTVDAKQPWREDGLRHSHQIDPLTSELTTRAMHEIQSVDEYACAESRRDSPSSSTVLCLPELQSLLRS